MNISVYICQKLIKLLPYMHFIACKGYFNKAEWKTKQENWGENIADYENLVEGHVITLEKADKIIEQNLDRRERMKWKTCIHKRIFKVNCI